MNSTKSLGKALASAFISTFIFLIGYLFESVTLELSAISLSITIVVVFDTFQKPRGRRVPRAIVYLVTGIVILITTGLILKLNDFGTSSDPCCEPPIDPTATFSTEEINTVEELFAALGSKLVKNEQMQMVFRKITDDILVGYANTQAHAILDQSTGAREDLEKVAKLFLQTPDTLQGELNSSGFKEFIEDINNPHTCEVHTIAIDGVALASTTMYIYPSYSAERCPYHGGYLYGVDNVKAVGRNEYRDMNDRWWKVEVGVNQYCWVFGHEVCAAPETICTNLPKALQ